MTAVRALALAWALLAAGCASVSTAPSPTADQITPFDFSGRVLVNHDGRAFSAALRWQHVAGRDEIWLLTPVGQTLAHIVAEGDSGALLTAADKRQLRAASVEELTRRALGWELPVASLKYWVRGETAPGRAPETVVHGDDRRIAQLEQGGWRIAVAYFPPHEYEGLPRRLDLAGESQAIRLVIDVWRTATAAP